MTQYAILITAGQAAGHYVGDNRKWTDSPVHARRFMSMTQATIYATLEELDPAAYDVVPV